MLVLSFLDYSFNAQSHGEEYAPLEPPKIR